MEAEARARVRKVVAEAEAAEAETEARKRKAAAEAKAAEAEAECGCVAAACDIDLSATCAYFESHQPPVPTLRLWSGKLNSQRGRVVAEAAGTRPASAPHQFGGKPRPKKRTSCSRPSLSRPRPS